MPDYRFTNSWFVNNRFGKRGTIPKESTQQVFERLLIPEASRGGCRRILEIGLSEGRSSIWMLSNLKPDLWVGIDAWQWGRQTQMEYVKQQEKNFWHNLREAGCVGDMEDTDSAVSCPAESFTHGSTACYVCKGLSQNVLLNNEFDTQFANPFDCIYLDGDHTGPGTILDAVLCWRKLAVGGLMIFDDFDRRWHNARPCTHEAVLAFWMTHEHFCEKVFENRFQFWVRKTAN